MVSFKCIKEFFFNPSINPIWLMLLLFSFYIWGNKEWLPKNIQLEDIYSKGCGCVNFIPLVLINVVHTSLPTARAHCQASLCYIQDRPELEPWPPTRIPQSGMNGIWCEIPQVPYPSDRITQSFVFYMGY